jgi:hypothetical protein
VTPSFNFASISGHSDCIRFDFRETGMWRSASKMSVIRGAPEPRRSVLGHREIGNKDEDAINYWIDQRARRQCRIE